MKYAKYSSKFAYMGHFHTDMIRNLPADSHHSCGNRLQFMLILKFDILAFFKIMHHFIVNSIIPIERALKITFKKM